MDIDMSASSIYDRLPNHLNCDFEILVKLFSKKFIFQLKTDTINELLEEIKTFDIKKESDLLIFIFELRNSQNINQFDEIKGQSIKLSLNCSLLLQLNFHDKNTANFYFKDETSNQLIEVNQMQNNFAENLKFPNFLCSFINGELKQLEQIIIEKLALIEDGLLILRFMNSLNRSEDFNEKLNVHIEKSLNFLIISSIENKNREVMLYLINYHEESVRNLTFEEQYKISTLALAIEQFCLLNDLLNLVDFPFPDNFLIHSISNECLKTTYTHRVRFHEAIQSNNKSAIHDFKNSYPRIKIGYNLSNECALNLVKNKKENYETFLLLKSYGFKSNKGRININEKYIYAGLKIQATNQNVEKSLANSNKFLHSLKQKTKIHNVNIDKETKEKYESMYTKLYEEIINAKHGWWLLSVASSCNDLIIVLDFESISVSIFYVSCLIHITSLKCLIQSYVALI